MHCRRYFEHYVCTNHWCNGNASSSELQHNIVNICSACTQSQQNWCFDMQVDEAEVDRLHKIFYDKVAELFTQHKDSFKGYERVKLIMI